MNITSSSKRTAYFHSLVYTMLFGLAAHAYRFFSLSYSHDSLMVFQNDFEHQISIGRFLHSVYLNFRGQLCAPFLLGLLSLLWMSGACYLIIQIFKFKTKISQIITCGIITTSSAFSLLNATYIHEIDVYMFALLLSIYSVYLYQKYKYGFLIGIIPITISLALYQAYIQVSAIMFMILVVKDLFDQVQLKAVFINILKMLCTLLGGLILYYVTFQLVLQLSGTVPSRGYNSLSYVGNYVGFSRLALLFSTYVYPLEKFIRPETFHSGIVAILHIITALLCIIGMKKVCIQKNISKLSLLLLVLVVALMPFGMNFVYFIAKASVHSLMTCSFMFFYLFALMIFEQVLSKQDSNLTAQNPIASRNQSLLNALPIVISSFIIFSNIVFANQLYLKKDLEYQSTLSSFTRIVDRMEQTEDYVPNETQVAIIGWLNDSDITANRDGMLNNHVGLFGNASTTYYDTYELYFHNILGYPINLVSAKQSNEFSQMPEVLDMPAYPAKNSLATINNVLVIKLSK